MASSKLPRLSVTLVAFSILAFCVAVFAVAMPIRTHISNYERNVQSEEVLRAGRSLDVAVTRAMEREWDSLTAVAQTADFNSPDRLRDFADAVARASDGVEWVGFANASGNVVAGSNRLLEGESVSSTSWYRQGLSGGASSDVFRLLAEQSSSSARSFVNLSVPIEDGFDRAVGVAVYSLRLDWVSSYMASVAADLGLDVMVLNSRGEVVLNEQGSIDTPFNESVVSLAEMGHELTRHVATTRNEPSNVIGVFPSMFSGDLPSFGWDMFVRVPAREGRGSLSAFMSQVTWSIAGLFLAISLGTAWYSYYYLRPIEKLASDAEGIVAGSKAYPFNKSTSREGEKLASALAYFQSALGNLDKKPGG